jgi:hypothetical protein
MHLPRTSPDEELLGQLAMQFRGARRDAERQAVARDYAEAVDRSVRSGVWQETPVPEEQPPDDWMPKAFFEYWTGAERNLDRMEETEPNATDGKHDGGQAATNAGQAQAGAPAAEALAAMAPDFDWTGWSSWFSLDALDLKSITSGPGAYVIAADRPITRAIGVDAEGFLDVGESGLLRKRLRDFKKCAGQRGSQGHMAGWRYAFFRFERQFPLHSLRIRWVGADSKAAAYRAEGRILLAYIQRHCELPPLNYKFNWDVFEESGWHIFDDPPPLKTE